MRYQEEILFLENVENKEKVKMNSRKKWTDEQIKELQICEKTFQQYIREQMLMDESGQDSRIKTKNQKECII